VDSYTTRAQKPRRPNEPPKGPALEPLSGSTQWALHGGWAKSSTRIFFAQLFQKVAGYTSEYIVSKSLWHLFQIVISAFSQKTSGEILENFLLFQ